MCETRRVCALRRPGLIERLGRAPSFAKDQRLLISVEPAKARSRSDAENEKEFGGKWAENFWVDNGVVHGDLDSGWRKN